MYCSLEMYTCICPVYTLRPPSHHHVVSAPVSARTWAMFHVPDNCPQCSHNRHIPPVSKLVNLSALPVKWAAPALEHTKVSQRVHRNNLPHITYTKPPLSHTSPYTLIYPVRPPCLHIATSHSPWRMGGLQCSQFCYPVKRQWVLTQ